MKELDLFYGPFDEEAEDFEDLEIYDEELLSNSDDDLVEEFNYDINELDEEIEELEDVTEVDDLDSAIDYWDEQEEDDE